MKHPSKELHGITILRFLAALYVFIFHINMRIPVNLGSTMNQVLSNGSIGMTLFFVLSGFVLTYSYYGEDQKDYFKKRIARIYPAYLACGLITAPFLYINHKDALSTSIIVFLFLFCLQAWIYQSFFTWNFSGTWSVSVEVFFYAIFPFLCKVINNKNARKILLVSYAISALLVPISLSFSHNYTFAVYYATPMYRLPEFIIGICAGVLFKGGARVNGTIAFFAFLTLAFASSLKNANSMQINYLTVPSLTIIIAYLAEKNFTQGMLTSPLIYLGRISYSLYLMQLPILYYLDEFKPSIFKGYEFTSWFFLFALNIAMAAACHRSFENNKSIKSFIFRLPNKNQN